MIHTGDCITVMATMPPDSVDAIVTDPPYGLSFMGKAWDRPKPRETTCIECGNDEPTEGYTVCLDCLEALGDLGDKYAVLAPAHGGRNMLGHISKNWNEKGTHSRGYADNDNPAFQAWCEQWGREALRVTKPGGYLLAFGGTRTHHRLVCGLEDAGWIIRDELDWIYASGFPKGKANLKPAHEPIVLARKPGPLRPLGIDATRIAVDPNDPVNGAVWTAAPSPVDRMGMNNSIKTGDKLPAKTGETGRWPSNVLLSDPELFDEPNPYVVGSGATSGGGEFAQSGWRNGGDGDGVTLGLAGQKNAPDNYGDSGGYSRFFIVPKADRADREPVLRGTLEKTPQYKAGGVGGTGGYRSVDEAVNAPWRENSHPTVKPTDLMRHLVRLVTPSGGTVLDPFLGSGSTALACELEGFPWIGIEKEPEYVAIAEARLNGTQRGMGLDTPLVGEPRKPSHNPAGVFGTQKVDQTTDTPTAFAVRKAGDGIFGYDPPRPPKPEKPEADTAAMFDEDPAA